MKVHHLPQLYLFVSLSLMMAVTAFVPASSFADWTSGLPSSNALIKSASVVSNGNQCLIDAGTSYTNTKYDDTWQVQQQMACIINNWDCTGKQVTITIESSKTISFEAYVLIGGVRQAPTVTGSFGNSGGKISLTFTVS